MARALAVTIVLWCGCALAVTEQPFLVKTDNVPQAQIAGTLWRADGTPRGTLFMAHGFHRSMWDFRGYTWITENEHFNVVRFDFREHGSSSHSPHLPTLGYYEIYDLKAVIDWAEANHLEKPYLCYGHSMGAAISLRWAGDDRRISGVLAQSPFRNGLDATAKFRPNDNRVKFATGLFVHGGYKWMLEQVDIPAAVAKRDDLLVWLSCGDRDYFPEADQRAILAASASPASMKKFTLIPDCEHGGQWRWSGNDGLIRAFLEAGAQPSRPLRVLSSPVAPVGLTAAPAIAAKDARALGLTPRTFGSTAACAILLLGIIVALRYRRRSSSLG
jgi:pimeloyl-ACP methyl ester carboxylesterase